MSLIGFAPAAGATSLVGHVVPSSGNTYIQQADNRLSEIRQKSSAHATLGL
jgi:hypothetical protein